MISKQHDASSRSRNIIVVIFKRLRTVNYIGIDYFVQHLGINSSVRDHHTNFILGFTGTKCCPIFETGHFHQSILACCAICTFDRNPFPNHRLSLCPAKTRAACTSFRFVVGQVGCRVDRCIVRGVFSTVCKVQISGTIVCSQVDIVTGTTNNCTLGVIDLYCWRFIFFGPITLPKLFIRFLTSSFSSPSLSN